MTFKKLINFNRLWAFHCRLVNAHARRLMMRVLAVTRPAEKGYRKFDPQSGGDQEVCDSGAFKLGHLQPGKLILLNTISTFLPFLP